jgi:8-oxo-dGTP pyrophosphatase MutT (NUDIX family)
VNLAEFNGLLDSVVPFDEREARYLDRIRSLDVPDPFSRWTFDPGHITASGFVLSPDRLSLLLVLHRKLATWLQPGGHVEPEDRDVIAAQRREIQEETGVTGLEWLGLFDVDIHDYPARGAEPAHEHFDVRSAFVARTWAVEAGGGVDEARWFRLNQLPRSDPSLTRPAAKLRIFSRTS